MTTSARINADIRMIAAGLAANEAVTRPGTITATGREAPSQFAIVPSSFPTTFALHPHIDYHDVPDRRPGGGFVGGRLSSIVPYLEASVIPVMADLRVALKHLPVTRDQIRCRLRSDAGLWWAPGALFSLTGWEDESVYVWLDRQREDGPEAKLCIALQQATYALRKMWLRVGHHVGAPPANLASWWPSLATQCGAVAVGRALLDVASMLFRIIGAMQSSGDAISSVSQPMQKIKILIEQFVYYVEESERYPAERARKKLLNAFKAARDLLDAVAIFSVAPEADNLRWDRLHAELYRTSIVTASPFAHNNLAGFEARLKRLSAADLGNRLEKTMWRNHTRRSLLRLASPDPAVRLAGLDRVRADLIYKLAMTGRLDRLYNLFPWLGAPNRAFVNCAGGSLGALATLLECGRRLQIARQQKYELGDVMDDETAKRQRAAVKRLTIPTAREFWRSEIKMAAAAGHGYVAGMALEHGAFSHATVMAQMHGAYFAPEYPLIAAKFGSLGWSLPAALRDSRTVASARSVEQARPIMKMRDHDDDLPRCNGMTLRRQLAETIVMALTTKSSDKAGPARLDRAVNAAVIAGRPGEAECEYLTAQGATNELLKSMLSTLEVPFDDHHRDAIFSNVVPFTLLTGEGSKLKKQQTDAIRKTVQCEVGFAGQGVRIKACKERSMKDERYALLPSLAYDIGHWATPTTDPDASRVPGDELLEDILRGRADLGQLTPVGALSLPIIWFAPLIDRQRLHWIASGASVKNAPPGSSAQRDGIALQVSRAHAWAPMLYSKTLLTGRSVNVACVLFTGRSPITADLSLAYMVEK